MESCTLHSVVYAEEFYTRDQNSLPFLIFDRGICNS